MRLDRIIATMIVVAVCLTVIVPLLLELVHGLLVPAVIAVALYIVVRVIHAYLDRW